MAGFILLFLLAGPLHGQDSPFDSLHREEASRIRERVVCLTDRSLYISGETIRFRCTLNISGIPEHSSWSSVLYLELVTASGRGVAFGKYPLHQRVATGVLPIPGALLTGNYYLRCYTRWMRNRGPETYGYTPLTILHSRRAIMETEMVQGSGTSSLTGIRSGDRGAVFTPHPSHYGRGDTVSLELIFPGKEEKRDLEGCLTVVPVPAKPHLPMQITDETRADGEDQFRLDLLPDLKGMVLSGTVDPAWWKEKKVGLVRVHFTFLGAYPGYRVVMPDATGRFRVLLPGAEGRYELFVQPEGMDGSYPEVMIDQDFDQRRLQLPHLEFSLSDSAKRVALQLVHNVQVREMIDSLRHGEVNKENERSQAPFYGKVNISVDLDQYVQLPNMREVFANLVPGVYPVTGRNRMGLVIRGENPLLTLYEPLIMVDQVPCLDPEQLMVISPGRIRWIDVVDDAYVVGDQVFGGIINLRSREGDMAGIRIPDNAFFVDFEAFQPSLCRSGYEDQGAGQLPDHRNTVYWNSRFRPGDRISFAAPSGPGAYVVLFRGLDSDGDLLATETVFHIH